MTNKTELYIKVFHHGKIVFIGIPATKIIIPGWENFDFFIHHSLSYIDDVPGQPMKAILNNGWRVSDGITGLYVTWTVSTQEEAKKIAIEKLKEIPKERLQAIHEKAFKDNDVSPAYSNRS